MPAAPPDMPAHCGFEPAQFSQRNRRRGGASSGKGSRVGAFSRQAREPGQGADGAAVPRRTLEKV